MTKSYFFNFNSVDPSWQLPLSQALQTMGPQYLQQLQEHTDWLPGAETIFNAFSIPVNQINYILLGESPYPREKSANGYAFWDAAVTDLWSPQGMSKPVNRATSLRNMIKMLLVAEGCLLPGHTTQSDIAQVDKGPLLKTNSALFRHLLDHGFLLLNASLVLQSTSVRKDAIAWQPFIKYILDYLFQQRPEASLILFGNIAKSIDQLIQQPTMKRLYAEHPYNHSFITNPHVIAFFRPLHLLTLPSLCPSPPVTGGEGLGGEVSQDLLR